MAPLRPAFVERLTKLPAVGSYMRSAHDEWLKRRMQRYWNSRATLDARLFDAHPPILSAAQQRVVDDLSESGVAVAEWSALCDSAHLWGRLVDQAEAYAARATADSAPRRGKDYIRMMHGERSVLRADDVLVQIGVSSALLGVANSYMKRAARLFQADIWHTVADTSGREPRGSQLWHRDPEDVRILKVFAYVRGVSMDAGPLTYVRASQRGQRYGNLWPQILPYGNQAPDADINAHVQPNDIQVCAHPAGSLVFADTAGLHRGGRAVAQDRLFGVWTYVTGASPRRRYVDIDPQSVPNDVDPVTSVALGHTA